MPQRSVRRIVLCAVAALAAGCRPAVQPPPPAPSSDPAPQVLVFSDLHFNPFSDPALVGSLQAGDVSGWPAILARSAQQTFSAYGSDTNYPLLESAIAAMQQAVPAPDLVLFAGDFMAHRFQSAFKQTAPDTSASALAAFADKTNQFLARRMAAAFPDAQILPALGNNDSGCGDYMSAPSSPFLRAFAEAWQPVVERGGSTADFVPTFSAAGHYTAVAPALAARVVVLNDTYWSPRYSNACGVPTADPGRDSLAWLNGVLAASRSRGEQVWLLSHVPIGIDVFATLRGSAVVPMLQPAYAAELISSLREFATTVRQGIYGHTHMMEFRVIADANGRPLVGNQGIPGVSPIFGNNPAFVVLTLDRASRAITDYAVHTLTNLSAAGGTTPAVWSKEYSFREAYGGEGLSAADLAELQGKLGADANARANFMRFYDSGSGRAGPTTTTWRAYWCGIGNVDALAFMRCSGG
jgi:sphingomyelin phosphodiesterase acid-like 3